MNEFDDGANAEEYIDEVINVSADTSILSLENITITALPQVNRNLGYIQ